MRTLVKVYIDVPVELHDRDTIHEFFEEALQGNGGQHRPTDPRFILSQVMEILAIQVGPKKRLVKKLELVE